MSRPFSQESFYEEAKPHFWRKLVPVAIVLCAGAIAYCVGTSTETHLTQRISPINGPHSAPTVERVVIGQDDLEIMAPSPTLPPPISFTVLQAPAPQVKRTVPVTKPKSEPVVNPLQDNTIPFRPAEEYPPGLEQPVPLEDHTIEAHPTSAPPQLAAPLNFEQASPIPAPETSPDAQ